MPHDDFSPSLSHFPVRHAGQPGAVRLKPRNGLVLYYPGAGRDYGPLQHFALNLDLAVAVYVDYLGRPDMVRDMLRSVCATMPELRSVTPQDLGCHAWTDFWPEDRRSQAFAPVCAFGVHCDLRIHPGRSTRLIYLATEGHQTFGQLLGTALQPDLVVLQDHAPHDLGGWCDFGGPSPMYHMAQAAGALPRWLFSADGNTRVWPGYEAIGEPVLLAGQMRHEPRTLYRRL